MAPAGGEDLASAMQAAMGAFARASELLAQSPMDDQLPPMEALSSASAGVLSSAKPPPGQRRSQSFQRPAALRAAAPVRLSHSALQTRPAGGKPPAGRPRSARASRDPGAPAADWTELTPVEGELPSLAELANMPVLPLVDKERLARERRQAEMPAPPIKAKPAFKGTPAPPRPPPLRSAAAVSAAAVAEAIAHQQQQQLSPQHSPAPGSPLGVEVGDGLDPGTPAHFPFSPRRSFGAHVAGGGSALLPGRHSAYDGGGGSPNGAAGVAAQRVAEARAARRAKEEHEQLLAEFKRAEMAAKNSERVAAFRAEQTKRLVAAERAKRSAAAEADDARRVAEDALKVARAEGADRAEHVAHESAVRAICSNN
ncbi:hypothetical protein T492DRAFT_115450 [Pavlovales sp. CCMP2436]|nr:hypothetical protein T492DRAFT_115450 [Pavlovales sp. CCMP2436]